MMLSPVEIATASLAVAVIDRLLLKRKQITVLSVGSVTDRGRAFAFPVRFHNRSGVLKGAYVEYWLRDTSDPTTVINGKCRTLDITKKGTSEEFLLVDKKYITSGEWELHIRVTHGNCRWNPLYRWFPVQSNFQQNYILHV
ncbi:MAG: lysis protein [Plesiomonas sp.]|uniref:lysis protein n=1 Tax=Plesiomonas sp. TaxID=2486279 RepID=UPI003F361D05